MKKIKLPISLLAIGCIFVACSMEPKVTELSNTADPQAEIEKVDNHIREAQENQVNVLSPDSFELAKKARDKAVKDRSSNKDQKTVLRSIALSQAYLDKANRVTNVANQILQGPIAARKDALTAQAHIHFPKELELADKNLKSITEQIEDNDTASVDRKKVSLEAAYRDLELKSLKKEKLGMAQSHIEEAVKEGAKKLTPETLTSTLNSYAEAEKMIEEHRHEQDVVEKARVLGIDSSQRLLKMVRFAKGSTAKNPEDFAKQMESNEIASEKSKSELGKSAAALANTQGKLATQSKRNMKLESQAWLNEEYEKARKEFTENEADVYKQGDKLILRLKGLSFANNKSEVRSDSFALLAKVQKVISDIGDSEVIIEGHTDASGGKKLNEELSSKRALSIQDYLVANKSVELGKIKAIGLGDTKPIATNKTPEGRSQNRRVDVIITAKPDGN